MILLIEDVSNDVSILNGSLSLKDMDNLCKRARVRELGVKH